MTERPIFFKGLNFFRFFAAISIVFFHLLIPYANKFEEHFGIFISNLNINVDFFFLISGFLIVYLLVREKKETGTIHLYGFYVRRALRILPLYYLILIIALLIGGNKIEYEPFLYFLGNFHMINTNQWSFDVLTPLWSLNIEEHFYLFIPFAISIIPLRYLKYFFISLVIISISYRIYAFLTIEYPWFRIYLNTLSRIDIIAIGGLIGLYYNEQKSLKKVNNWVVLLAITSFLFLMSFINASDYSTLWRVVFIKYVFIIPLVALIYFITSCKNTIIDSIKENKIFEYLGKCSFGVYVFHSPIMNILGNNFQFNKYVFFILVIVITIGISILSYLYFERPIMKLSHARKHFIEYATANKTKFIWVIILLHFILKLAYLDVPSIWYDEAFSIYHSQFSFGHILDISLNDQNPPIYNIILKLWIDVFGNSLYAARLLSVIFSVLACLLLYRLAKKYISYNSAIIASVLFLIWNEIIYYSMEARCYTLVFLLVLVSVNLLFKIVYDKKNTIVNVSALAIINVLLLLSHYLTIFFLITQFVFVITLFYKNKRVFVPYLVSVVVSALLFLPWLLKIKEVLEQTSGGNYWLKAATLKDLDYLIIDFFNNYITFSVVSLIIIFGTIIIIMKKQLNKIYLFFLFITIIPVFASYSLSNVIPVFLGRYILYTLLGVIMLLAIILSHKSINVYARQFALCILVVLLIFEVKINPIKNQDYKTAVQYINENIDNKTLIVVSPRSISLPFCYYYKPIIFNNLDYFEWELLKENVILVDNVDELNRINLSVYKKIINIKSFGEYFDKKSQILDSLNKNFKNIANNFNARDAAVRIYENENYEQQLKQLFPNTNINQLSFYCPFNIVYTDSANFIKIQKGVKFGTEIRYHLSELESKHKKFYIRFNSILLSADNSIKLNILKLDERNNIQLDTLIDLSNTNQLYGWNEVPIEITNRFLGVGTYKISFINELENTDMNIKDLEISVY